ncbi:MAG: sulfate/thiosulfate transport system substrate-binding protein [Gaiellaceae bacterium]|nr:sulfate/thiosulfate transport system substrate-binding protein [Gaiellaceae bacterium]
MRIICMALVGVAMLAGSAAGASKGTSIDLVGYSTPKDAYGKIISAFQKTSAGNGSSFNQSYNASGDQARAVAAGLKADVVALALDPDINLLVGKGLVPKNWAANSHKGIVSDSVVVLVVRDGNPKHIKGWGDLIKPGVQVITPNPFTSGAARWNVMAAYGAQRKAGKTDKQAIAYLKKFFQHVPVQPDSARAALQVFAQGKGDVLITYENEAIYAEKKGVHTEYRTPKSTLLIETPVALTKTGLKKPAAKAFYKFLWSSTAQKAFASQGFRPVVKSVAKNYKFYKPAGLFTINTPKLGLNGWTKVQTRFFHPQTGIVARIEKSLGH